MSKARGFAVTRLLTHWAEVVGEVHAGRTRPVKVGYGRGGLGATLTVLVSGAHAPMVQADLPKILDRVNAVYGYRAVARIHLTQTAPEGFSDGRAQFDPAPRMAEQRPNKELVSRAQIAADGVEDTGLRTALEALGANVYLRAKPEKDKS